MKNLFINISSSKFLATAALIIILQSYGLSQNYSISGTITDTLNNPLQYINVAISGTTFGDASDENGKYEITNLPNGNYTIKYSAIGYKAVTKADIIINSNSMIINIVLREEILNQKRLL
ncbi:MAG: hypothetical protein DRQ01_00650 [Ignavibacteriae bacterium]|nr:MAG: hypothetical protein DRQ01_00650 [Ignavibacteriota bacterium]